MSIFLIIAIVLIILVVIEGIYMLVSMGIKGDWRLTKKAFIINSICCVAFLIGGVLLGIGFNTEDEKVFVKKYLAQKQTIEMSLKVDELSGLERIELVKQATELNGELAERKSRFGLWHFVVYDSAIYEGVELINFNQN